MASVLSVAIWKPIGFLCDRRLYTFRHARKPIGTMSVRDRDDARIAALAAEQFHEHGITATGVDALSRAAGISKRTLYERFGSKDGLIAAAYDGARPARVPDVHGIGRGRSQTTPRGQLEAFFAQLEAMVRLPEFRGCPFTNAAAELADRRPPGAQGRSPAQGADPAMDAPPRARRGRSQTPSSSSRQLMLVFAGAQSQALLERSAAAGPRRERLSPTR